MKNKDNKPKIYHKDIWGLRKEKAQWLESHSIAGTDWQEITPTKPYYFFVPRSRKGWDLYQSFWKVTDIFPVNSVGVVTSRDRFVIDFNKQSLEGRIRDFRGTQKDTDSIKSAYDLRDKKNRWFVDDARRELRRDKDWENYFAKILYRPFDERWIYYHPAVIERDRWDVMQHMLKPNLGLITNRTIKTTNIDHFWVADKISDLHIIETANASAYTFPLHLYKNNSINNCDKKGRHKSVKTLAIFDADESEYGNKKSNIAPKLFNALKNQFGKKTTPEDIFYYIYSILYSNTYREKYQEFLKIDFPRIPFTADYEIFKELTNLGKSLVNLHLLKSPDLDSPIARFPAEGNNLVDKKKSVGRNYNSEEKRIYINKDEQYFEGIDPEVWEYKIGGYQVLDKWLKDRGGRYLNSEEIKHYCRIVTALARTIELQESVDKFYPEIEKDLIEAGM
ncbi:MAG: type ISP restriction/modification enzyme [Patescibacteria group bacterium]